MSPLVVLVTTDTDQTITGGKVFAGLPFGTKTT
jgi:hypothetical protein